MKTQAAVVYEAGKPIEIEELELDKPQDGEVLIRYTHAGLCHSDVHVAHGDLEARLPMVLGHEGAGIIEEVGPGVTRVKAGDHVVCSFIPNCGTCRYCANGQQSICDMGATILEGYLPGERFPITGPRGEYGAMCMLGTFSQYGVIHQNSVRQGRRRPAAGEGRARRLRRADRVGLGGQHRERPPGRDRGDLRHRRHRHQRGAGRPATPARRTSSPSTRWRTSARRRWSSARPTRSRRPTRRMAAITDMTRGQMADSAILTPGLMTAEIVAERVQRGRQGRRRRADRAEQAHGADHRAARHRSSPCSARRSRAACSATATRPPTSRRSSGSTSPATSSSTRSSRAPTRSTRSTRATTTCSPARTCAGSSSTSTEP